MTRFRVVLSAVSSELGQARFQVASDLRARGLEVEVQEDFRQEAAVPDARFIRGALKHVDGKEPMFHPPAR
ncbi:MAG: hypothetical protein M3495_13360 [Pseudomonadota bacterium]|nr:hypothetical protein [Gammaproteobacteria bacterium]MDQ3582520.1 hypothetical protein [Pseudomonadota bacterium]